MSENAGEGVATMLRNRCGLEFDGECHLTEDEAEKLAVLAEAAAKVLRGLNARVETADPSSVPVFSGIADLSDALNACEAALT